MVPRDVDAAWMAGIFEGEGCISLIETRVQLSLAMTDRDVVERFATLSGYGVVKARSKRTGAKQMFSWQIGEHANVRRLLLVMLPYFGERRKAVALEALGILRGNSGPGHYHANQLYAFGERKWLSDWNLDARCLVSSETLRWRVKRGWDPERALTTPVKK